MSQQLKAMKKRMTKAQLEHREYMKQVRKDGLNITQDKDRKFTIRLKIRNIG